MKGVGEVFGSYTIIDKWREKSKYKLKLKCKCGNEVIKRTDYLSDARANLHCGCKT